MRKSINYKPYVNLKWDRKTAPWEVKDLWPASWIGCNIRNKPFVAAYKLEFTAVKDIIITVHVSADERYELYFDGEKIGRGSERGDENNWYFETYELEIKKGKHVIVAKVWALREFKPLAQLSVYPGFIFSPEGEENIKMLATGVANWVVKELKGYSFTDSVKKGTVTGAEIFIDGNEFAWGYERGEGQEWREAEILDSGYDGSDMNMLSRMHVMKPSTLPPMLARKIATGSISFFEYIIEDDAERKAIKKENDRAEESNKWKLLLKGDMVTIPPNKFVRLIIDLENYYCAYPEVIVSDGKDSIISISWAEALYEEEEKFKVLNDGRGNNVKKNRNDIYGKIFSGVGDKFKLNGGNHCKYETLWWRAGRYIEIIIKTEKQTVTINNLNFYETRYPLELESSFNCNDERINKLIPILFRSLQQCAHETYMDCPYWEQLMYIGDTRLQALTAYVSSSDDLLQRKALKIIYAGKSISSGLINDAYPQEGGKVIPSFCLWWIGMVYDFALWREDKQFINSLMSGVREIIDVCIKNMSKGGLIKNPQGWNFIDWAVDKKQQWSYGVPPDGGAEVNSIFNFQMVYTLNLAAELEQYIGEPEMAKRAKRLADELKEKIVAAFWSEEKGLFSDDLKHKCFSEHGQCMAVLSKAIDERMKKKILQSLLKVKDIAHTSIYFKHYLFETYEELNLEDRFYEDLEEWFKLEVLGLKTTPEIFSEQSRSDCHGWGAHPLYHFFTYILGIRPKEMGFKSVIISPHLGDLKEVSGTMNHNAGKIAVEYRVYDDIVKAKIILPKMMNGKFLFKNIDMELLPGKNELEFKN